MCCLLFVCSCCSYPICLLFVFVGLRVYCFCCVCFEVCVLLHLSVFFCCLFGLPRACVFAGFVFLVLLVVFARVLCGCFYYRLLFLCLFVGLLMLCLLCCCCFNVVFCLAADFRVVIFVVVNGVFVCFLALCCLLFLFPFAGRVYLMIMFMFVALLVLLCCLFLFAVL